MIIISLFQYDDLGNSIQGQALNTNQNTTYDETILFYKQLNNQILFTNIVFFFNLFSLYLRSDASGNNIDTFQNSVIKPINHYSKLPDLIYHQSKDSSSLHFYW
ncbi:MAG: hypothetical protein IPL21_14350 [Saprospirales bacterium]|nr:hypothetical protein [Saprospirales bacterium]